MPDKSWRHTASRLAAMDRRELLSRTGQELAKRYDTLLSRVGFDFARGLVRSCERQAMPVFLRIQVSPGCAGTNSSKASATG